VSGDVSHSCVVSVKFIIALAIAVIAATTPALASRMVYVEIPSDRLSAFWKTPMTLRADVLLPDSYDKEPARRYPVLYWFFGYGGNFDRLARESWGDWMRAFAAAHDTIVVFPDPMLQYVYTEFADSANSGPWGAAFTTEFVPSIDKTFRTNGRYLGGHSSGGWAALWLQTTYPGLFAGAWSYAPDPVDFHDFTGPDLTATPPGNFYGPNSSESYVMHLPRRAVTLREMAQGDGGSIWVAQFMSFEAVFSPKGSDGYPEQLFDRKTGAIDSAVATYWEAHYDIAALMKARWAQIGPSLRGKIHMIVATHDTFGLDGAVRLFCKELDTLQADAECTFLGGGDHWTILDHDGGYEHHVIDEIFLTIPG
jgi:pimeloyl-ACP methyl ester carboxylesterase